MKHTVIPAMAAVAMAYGTPVKRDPYGDLEPCQIRVDWRGKPVPDCADELALMVGVLKRTPQTLNFSHCAAGDDVFLKTDGTIQALIEEMPVMLKLRDGKPEGKV